jgi:hypothetical protein
MREFLEDAYAFSSSFCFHQDDIVMQLHNQISHPNDLILESLKKFKIDFSLTDKMTNKIVKSFGNENSLKSSIESLIDLFKNEFS